MDKIKCVYCHSEVSLSNSQRFCKYCGKPLLNKCSQPQCNKELDDDALFCSYCGHESKFKIKGLVRPPIKDLIEAIEEDKIDVQKPIGDKPYSLNKTTIDDLRSLATTHKPSYLNASDEKESPEVLLVFLKGETDLK